MLYRFIIYSDPNPRPHTYSLITNGPRRVAYDFTAEGVEAVKKYRRILKSMRSWRTIVEANPVLKRRLPWVEVMTWDADYGLGAWQPDRSVGAKGVKYDFQPCIRV